MQRFAFFVVLFAVAFAVSMRDAPSGTEAAAAAGEGDDAASAAPTYAAMSREAPASAAGNGLAGVTLEREPDSHFYLDMQVNGRSVRFLVDTGASSVALSRADARRLGLQVGPHDFTGTAQTANGPAAFAPVTLDSMRTGPLAAQDVEAVVLDLEDGMPLLGQSFLRRLDQVTVRDDVMTLR